MHAGRVLATAVVVLLVPVPLASAANEAKPRVPVLWGDVPCATVVDQSVEPIIHFDYSVALEEDPADRTSDEVDDSRTHQFFAFRRQDLPGRDPPAWITRADIERASAKDPKLDPHAVAPDAVLEGGPRFSAEEWVRITPDDARVPITFEQASLGVDWDTSSVAPGTYEIWAYTWEPKTNIWSRRPGFVKVIASERDAAEAGPSVSLLPDETVIAAGDRYVPPGCADVAPGSVVTLEWGAKTGTIVPEWNFALAHQPVETGLLALEFFPPSATVGASTVLRATVTDGECRSYVAYSPRVLAVLASPGPVDDVAPSRGDDPCESAGCGCRSTQPRFVPLTLATLFLIGLRVKRTPRPRRTDAATCDPPKRVAAVTNALLATRATARIGRVDQQHLAQRCGGG